MKIDYINITVGVNDGNIVPVTTSIKNFPNPFNPETTIQLTAGPNVEWTSLDIYNVKEQLIKTINVDNLRGSQTIKLNMSDQSSGVYFIRAASTCNGKSKNLIRKISLLK